MSDKLSNSDRLEMDKDYKPEDKLENDRRTAINSYCDPAMDRRSGNGRKSNG